MAIKTEGSFEDRLVQIMRSVNDNRGVSIQLGVVESPPPNPIIRLRTGNIELDGDDLLFTQSTIGYGQILENGDEVIVLCDFDALRFVVIDKAVTF